MMPGEEMSPEQMMDNERRIAMLDALGMALASKRADAIAARAASGIEQDWEGDEEFYQGFDAANRHEFHNSASKPTTGQSTTAQDKPAKRGGSTVFPNITQPYVDAAAARVGDMLLPTDDRNFAIEPTPLPDLGEREMAALGQQAPQQAMPQPGMMPGGIALAGAEGGAGQPPVPSAMTPAAAAVQQVADLIAKVKAEAAKKAEKAQTRIDDWLTECQYQAEVRKVIDDSAKLGSGVVKGPVPMKRRAQKWRKTETGEFAIEVIEEIKPASFRVDPWNLFPDPACGESIHDGAYIFERDVMTGRRLADMKGVPGYIDSQIDLCLTEGPATHTGMPRAGDVQNYKKEQFEVWYFHGIVTTAELMAAGCECDEDGPDEYPAMLTVVNNRVVRASINPLDSGKFPYDVIPWKRRPGMPWGMGVARQMRTAQRMVTAAARNLMDNAGLAGGPQIVVRRGVKPENGVWRLEPLKIWVESEDADGQAGAPFLAVTIPMLQVELTNIIQLGMKFAEETTGLPMLMQGQQGAAPDRVGVVQILNNNANAVLRRIARMFDSCITEPHIGRYYEWLMSYGEDEAEKGDFNIVARGSTALVERDIQAQEMVQIINMSVNPAFGINPKKAIQEYLKSRRFDPSAFEYSEEEQKAMANQAPPEDPRITAAKIMAQSAAEREQMRSEMTVMRSQIEQQESAAEREIEVLIAQIESGDNKAISVDQIRARLAEVAMKSRLQRELFTAGQVQKQTMAPPAEPPQRAPAGQAFAQ